MDGDDWIPESERLQIEHIRELEEEELQVEEVDDEESSDDDQSTHGGASGESLYDTSVVVLHSYLGDVEDTHNRLTFLDGGSVVNVTLFYLEGVVLFPDATLPLRVVSLNFIAGVDRAMRQDGDHHVIGVIRIYRDSRSRRVKFSKTGTTAEIRQHRRLEDGSINIVARGRQRFRVKRHWIDSEGLLCAEVLIVQEDVPLRTPKETVGKLAPFRNSEACRFTRVTPSKGSWGDNHVRERDNDDTMSEGSFESELSSAERSLHRSALVSYYSSDTYDESVSSDDDRLLGSQSERSPLNSPMSDKKSTQAQYRIGRRMISQFRDVPTAFWPSWVYRMYDSYYLARKVAERWKQIVKIPNVDNLQMQPDLLSFHVASKIPTSESTRQELLDIDGTTYRLRKEIELLESFDKLHCKTCKTLIAKRSDMLVMSSDGPLGAYANAHGYVHEVMTLKKTDGVAVTGRPTKEYSWFPGYAWSIAECISCGKQLGWYFSATKRRMQPKAFWGIRSSQVEDVTQ